MILAAVSGGLDSVVLAWRLLTLTDDTVHVHHVSLRSRSARWKAEDAAMNRVVPWLRERARPFGYTETRMKAKGADIVAVTGECARLIAEGAIPRPDTFVRGATAHDFARRDLSGRQQRAQARWKEILGDDAPPIEYPLRDMTRAQYLDGVPPELVAMTWSCRRPQEVQGRYAPCRDCRTCREMAAQGISMARDVPAMEQEAA